MADKDKWSRCFHMKTRLSTEKLMFSMNLKRCINVITVIVNVISDIQVDGYFRAN